MKTVAVVYGTRPEAIKVAPVIAELKKIKNLRTIVICSGQHKEMLEGILELWEILPDVILASHFDQNQTSIIPNLMKDLEIVLQDCNPDLVLVQGDTATATATMLQSHALHIPIGHIEAGLRSNDLWNPWPEESNRRIIDSSSSLHFAPTQLALENLIREDHGSTAHLTGNTIVDALQYSMGMLNRMPEIQINLEELLGFGLSEDFILFTQHRRESFGEGQKRVFDAIRKLSDLGHQIVFPVHMNPGVRGAVARALEGREGITLIEPQNYLSFLQLIKSSKLVISDSGGLQEEVPSFNRSILITRLRTERPEVIESGHGHIVGYDTELIIEKSLALVKKELVISTNPFGDGAASLRISRIVEKFLL